jgi:hypothetical protein
VKRLFILFSIVALSLMRHETANAQVGDSPTPLLRVEATEWARQFFNWYETGEISIDAMRFAYIDPSGPSMNPITEALQTFDNLTGHTAQDENDIWSYMASEPQVYNSFRHLAMTGTLVSSYSSPLAVEHLAYYANDPNTTLTEDGIVTSKKDKAGPTPNPLPDGHGDGVPDEWQDFWDDLQDAVNESHLAEIDLYIPDTYPDSGIPFWPFDNTEGSPGFDCDDYATAMEQYLEETFLDDYPDAEIPYLLVYWGGFGHAMTLVKQDGTYFVIDPQSGELVGPFSSVAEAEQGVRDILDAHYNYDESDDVTLNPVEESPSSEPPPYYTDPDILEQL